MAFRVTWESGAPAPRVLTADDFIAELEQLAARGYVGGPAGAVRIEELDESSRVKWRAYFRTAAELSMLLRQLLAEREMASRARR